MSTKICFNICMHECFDFFEEQIENIFYYNSECCIIAHISMFANITQFDQTILSKLKEKYSKFFINPNRLESHKGKVLTPVVANYLYSKELNIDYEYMCLMNSNELFFRKGAYEYMKNYDFGCFRIPAHTTRGSYLEEKHQDCIRFALFASESKSGQTYTGQHVGTFYKMEIFKKIMDTILAFCPLENMNHLGDTTEECFLPTAAFILFPDKIVGNPITVVRDRTPDILGVDTNYCMSTTVDFIEKMRKNNEYPGTYVLMSPITNIFVFNRVNRTDPNDALRNYLKSELIKS